MMTPSKIEPTFHKTYGLYAYYYEILGVVLSGYEHTVIGEKEAESV